VIGRTELLQPRSAAMGLDLSFVVQPPADPSAPRKRAWTRNGTAPESDLPSGPIDNSKRTIGAGLRDTRRAYRGSAGQSFGAWLDQGAELELEGEACDYVGKGMGGGVIAIRPFADDATSETPVLAGNTCLYGATGGALFLAGRIGERGCVRNSGAIAVVEGAGDHFCEYMTGGVAVALGAVGWNVGAGMTGGVAYLREWRQLSRDVVARSVPAEDAAYLKELVEEHARRTCSPLAQTLLADWPAALDGFRQVVPVAETQPKEEAAASPEPDATSAPAAVR
jgi:glutamate synthase domain-containing protein 3